MPGEMHNTRFPEIWSILIQHLDFRGAIVFDVGFGYGDLLKAALGAGAIVYGCDKDKELIRKVATEIEYVIFESDINTWNDEWYPFKSKQSQVVDILTCFSVIPYLDDPDKALKYFKKISKRVVIECQYRGDGPGWKVRNNVEMKKWLQSVWKSVKFIGCTHVEDRDKYRDIWLCQ